MSDDVAKKAVTASQLKAIGDKPFAYNPQTYERIYSTEAEESKAYRVREGFCHRVDAAGGSFFRFYSAEWHRLNNVPPPGGGSQESAAHEEAIIWIREHLRLGAAMDGHPLYIRLLSAVDEFWTGQLRPDLTCVVAECWPRVMRQGDKINIEVCVTHPVDPEKRLKLEAEGVATLEIRLDRALAKKSASTVLADRVGFTKLIERELSRCPDGEWLVAPT